MPFRRENRRVTVSLLILAVSIVVIGGGIQAYLAQQDNTARDRADQAYADCLTDFAEDLVATIEARSNATARLERASARKSRSLDNLVLVTSLFTKIPPEATRDEFRAALQARIYAQEQYDRVAAEVARVRQNNQYVSPKVVCGR